MSQTEMSVGNSESEYNSVSRKVFGYRDWESVSELQRALKRPTWEELLEKRTRNFMNSVEQLPLLNPN